MRKISTKMKAKSIISLLFLTLGVGSVTTSCEDMLTPDMNLYTEGTGTLRDTVNVYLGIMEGVQKVIEQNVLLGEVRGDLTATTSYTQDSIYKIATFDRKEDGTNALLNRSAYYYVINQCNFYLNRADTVSTKNGVYYMRKEAAQVILIRAWAYMQLVQNYKEVPFIVEPVTNANTGWESSAEKATVDNLLDLLINKGQLMQAVQYEKTLGFPNYGNYNTGYSGMNLNSQLLLFPSDVVLGDLYLLRGASQSDYEKAAEHYYTYLSDCVDRNAYVGSSVGASYFRIERASGTIYFPYASGWVAGFQNLSIGSYSTRSGEIQTCIPSAANSSFGLVLTRIPQIYGFDVHSTNTTSTSTDDEGTDVSTTSGQVSLTPNYKSRQFGPSNKYLQLCGAQIYRFYDKSKKEVTYVDNVGDARLHGSAPLVKTTDGDFRFIQKFGGANSYTNGQYASNFNFRYVIPIYRVRQVYLRFAEAVNRAGYPHFAFAILRSGLNANTVPTTYSTKLVSVDSTAMTKVYDVVNGTGEEYATKYISVQEAAAAANVSWLSFSAGKWENSMGIHEMGCGTSSDSDTVYVYNKMVAERIIAEANRANTDLTVARQWASNLLNSVATAYATSTTTEDGWTIVYRIPVTTGEELAAQINAVETIIADEMALETAFEGYRYYDLMRIARHKNNDSWLTSSYGTNWMAWLIARRNLDLAPYESPTQYDATLFGKLTETDNWFLLSPTN